MPSHADDTDGGDLIGRGVVDSSGKVADGARPPSPIRGLPARELRAIAQQREENAAAATLTWYR